MVLRGLASPGSLLAVYVALAAVSLAPAADRDLARRISWPLAVAVGVVAVVAARSVSGPILPAPVGSWAVPLAAAAAVSEEAFFRRLMFDRLARVEPGVAVAVTAVAFAAMHVPLYGGAAFWVDLGAGMLFGWQRWATGTWSAPAATHVAANLMAVLP
jgi:membrane protease YdiL (CAAX protease family)